MEANWTIVERFVSGDTKKNSPVAEGLGSFEGEPYVFVGDRGPGVLAKLARVGLAKDGNLAGVFGKACGATWDVEASGCGGVLGRFVLAALLRGTLAFVVACFLA